MLTLVRDLHGCLTQMNEVAQALCIETAPPPRTDYSSWDKGGHLDRAGSIAFTNDLVTALERTSPFQASIRKDARER